MLAPFLDHDLGIVAVRKPLHVPTRIAKRAIEALICALLPRPSRVAVHGRNGFFLQPLSTACAANSGPLSDLRYLGHPCTLTSFASTSTVGRLLNTCSSSFLAPHAMNPISARVHSFTREQGLNPSAPVPRMTARDSLHRLGQQSIAFNQLRAVAECRVRNRPRRACSPLGSPALENVRDGLQARLRAHHSFAVTPFITSISRSRSATSFFNRAFSVASSRRRRGSTGFSYPIRLRHR